MSKKKENLFERHIDKAVLGVAVVLSLYLLWVFVLGNPHAVQYGSVKLGPGEIDKYIEEQQVHELQVKLDGAAKSKIYSEARKKAPKFAKMYAGSADNIPGDLHFPIPGYGRQVSVDSRIYVLPEIGEVSDVAVERIRSVVYMPTEPVGADNPYAMSLTELKDIDLVTVEASFDVASLYKDFERCFSGRMVRRDWQDKNLAKPVFAMVSLERQQRAEDGSFGQWQAVKRTKIDDLKSRLGSIPDKIDDKHTSNLLMVKFDDFSVQREIVQPAAYDIAASNESWFSPRLHKEYSKLTEAEEEKLRREQQKIEKGSLGAGGIMGGRGGALGGRGGGRAGGMGARGGGRGGTGARGGGRAGGRAGGGRGGRGQNTRRANDRGRGALRGGTANSAEKKEKQKKKERTVKNVFDDFKKIVLTNKTDLSKMREPLVFWAHDDTLEPGESYRYRIRLGVFNPIAGRDWFREDQKDYRGKPILWSGYSKVTDVVEVPQMMHFFPVEAGAKEGNDVKIKVAKFHNGKWCSEDFKVRPGDMIGKTVKREQKTDDSTTGTVESYGGSSFSSDGTDVIDFSTGVLLVDVAKTTDWEGVHKLQQREYADVLYAKDDGNIEHLAAKMRFWPEELKQQFNVVKEGEKKVVLMKSRGQGSAFGGAGSMSTGRPGGMRGRRGLMGRRGMMRGGGRGGAGAR
ncbi:MAG: hypothetical protein ACYTFK_04150 [Planctomycetota bacterium]|jgi:hypothetical protein